MEISLHLVGLVMTWISISVIVLAVSFIWICWPINDKDTTKGQYYFWAIFNIIGNIIALAIYNKWITFVN